MKKLLLILICFFSVACGKFESGSEGQSIAASLADDSVEQRFQASAGTLDEDCPDKKQYDACIVWKNIRAQEETNSNFELSEDANVFDFSYYGVSLKEQTSPWSLEHTHFKVISSDGTTLELDDRWKEDEDLYTVHDVAQIMAYYYGQRTLEVLKIRTGGFYLSGEKIDVYVNDSLNGWAPSLNSIFLGKDSNGNSMAMNGEVISYYFNLANISVASEGRVDDFDKSGNHKDCLGASGQVAINGCCKTEMGCSKAVVSGLAEYMTALVFPESPIFGEGVAEQLEGQSRCNLSRNFLDLMDEESIDVFEACSEEARGDVFLMGSHMAAKIWGLREKLSETKQQGLLDRAVIKSLEELDGDDDFESYFEKLLDADEEISGGTLEEVIEEVAINEGWL